MVPEGSSTLKAIFRLVDSTADSMSFKGTSLQSTPPHQIVSLGMAYVPEGRRIFAGLSVRKNLMMGAYRFSWRHIGDRMDRVYDLFPALKKFDGALAGALSGGQQQMLAIGRALISQPKLLVLDEPSMGLAPVLIDDIARSAPPTPHRGREHAARRAEREADVRSHRPLHRP